MSQLTIFHITHQKAGSQWVREILKYCAPDRFVSQEYKKRQLLDHPIQSGKVYAAVYLNAQDFQCLFSPLQTRKFSVQGAELHLNTVLRNWINYKVFQRDMIHFLIIRDLRDTLISLYFSRKISHPILGDEHRQVREYLNEVSLEDGLLYLMNSELKELARIQRSWLDNPGLLVRYEDLLVDAHACFQEIIAYCQISVPPERLFHIVENNQFKNKTGREPGDEDTNAHLRKGIVGDWQNYFTKNVAQIFTTQYGQLLIDTNYENDLNWA